MCRGGVTTPCRTLATGARTQGATGAGGDPRPTSSPLPVRLGSHARTPPHPLVPTVPALLGVLRELGFLLPDLPHDPLELLLPARTQLRRHRLRHLHRRPGELEREPFYGQSPDAL